MKGIKDFYTVNKDLQSKEMYLKNLLKSDCEKRRVIYLHVPFCNKICSFCPFNKPTDLKRSTYDEYLINQMKELKEYNYFKAPFNAINFGGGTPTTLKPKQMDRVLNELRKNFDILENSEISIETTISELTDDMIDVFLSNGVNRLSIGVQTFDEEMRKRYNRRSTKKETIKTIEKVISKGIINTSIDLLYNAPSQSMKSLDKDLEIISSLNLGGVSIYSLRIHEGTPLHKSISYEECENMADFIKEKEFFFRILEKLTPIGYDMLELSKLVRNNIDKYEYMDIRHNGGECLPIGYGAAGNIGAYSYRNSSIESKFSEQIKISTMGRLLKEEYYIIDSLAQEMISSKVDFDKYSKLLGYDIYDFFKGKLAELENEKLINIKDKGFEMTLDGKFWGNNIINELLLYFLEEKM
ncbi:MAG: coproporphyrinogen-III oxidase family protein [Lachnospirales bacterium]